MNLVDPVVFECGMSHFMVDDRGVGHINYGQGSSIVSRAKVRAALHQIIRDAVDGLTKLDEIEKRYQK